MADALRRRGFLVTLVEQLPEVLPTVDTELGALVRAELAAHGVRVITGTAVERFDARPDGGVDVTVGADAPLPADVALVSVGVRPDSALAAGAGARTGTRDTIAVDATMATSLANVWAAGDCAETHHALTGHAAYMPLGTTAHKQGRVAGENAAGGRRTFAGALGTQVVKVVDLAIARTGLRDDEARAAGFDARDRERFLTSDRENSPPLTSVSR